MLMCSGIMLTSCQKKITLEQVQQQITEELKQHPGTFAIAFKDLTSQEEFFMNEREVFHAASTMKTPVMMEVFKQAAQGKFSMQDSILIKNEFYSIVDGSTYSLNPEDDSEQTLYTQVGNKRILADLVYDMIIVSSNLATNIIIELVDAQMVMESMREMGARDIQVLRGVEDSKAYAQGLNNTTTAFDLMLLFEKLGNGEVVSKEASKAMIDILLDQRFNEIIPAHLPQEVKVAHKTGTITGVHHDSGIVILPDGRQYVLVILSKKLTDVDAATKAMANVSKIVYDYVCSLPK